MMAVCSPWYPLPDVGWKDTTIVQLAPARIDAGHLLVTLELEKPSIEILVIATASPLTLVTWTPTFFVSPITTVPKAASFGKSLD
jgi:hypothetical protein